MKNSVILPYSRSKIKSKTTKKGKQKESISLSKKALTESISRKTLTEIQSHKEVKESAHPKSEYSQFAIEEEKDGIVEKPENQSSSHLNRRESIANQLNRGQENTSRRNSNINTNRLSKSSFLKRLT
jgi:hypothetical protein